MKETLELESESEYYMRRLRGRWRDSKSETKLLTESRELRSRAMTRISEPGHSSPIRALVSSAAFIFRAGRISLAPRFANTRAVSAPIPDVAPERRIQFRSNRVDSAEEGYFLPLTCDDGSDGAEIGGCFGDLLGRGLGAVAARASRANEVFNSFEHFGVGRKMYCVVIA